MSFEIIALALGASLVLTPPFSAFLKRAGVIDHPNLRSSHSSPVVRAGGLAPAIAASVAIVSVTGRGPSDEIVLLLAAAGFAEIGLADDFLGIKATYRFVWQILFAAAVLPSLIIGMGLDGTELILVGGAFLLWQVAFVNAFNFMDGINGISVAQTVVAGAAWMVVGYVEGIEILVTGGAIIGAAALGFAPFNFPRASVFLGDVGSYFIGGWLATLFLLGLIEGASPVAMVAPLAIYLADTSFTLLRRIRNGEVWYSAHKDHVYQQLNQVGWSHCRTTIVTGVVMLLSAAAGFMSLADQSVLRFAAPASIMIVAVAYLNLPDYVRLRTRV